MFNLDQAILEWRQQMAAGGIKAPEVLDEMESHLREDVQQILLGLSERQAFEIASQRIGPANALKREFQKIGSVAGTWQARRVGLISVGCVTVFLTVMLLLSLSIAKRHRHERVKQAKTEMENIVLAISRYQPPDGVYRDPWGNPYIITLH